MLSNVLKLLSGSQPDGGNTENTDPNREEEMEEEEEEAEDEEESKDEVKGMPVDPTSAQIPAAVTDRRIGRDPLRPIRSVIPRRKRNFFQNFGELSGPHDDQVNNIFLTRMQPFPRGTVELGPSNIYGNSDPTMGPPPPRPRYNFSNNKRRKLDNIELNNPHQSKYASIYDNS